MAFNFLHIAKMGLKHTDMATSYSFPPLPKMSVAHSCPKHVYWNILWQWKWQYFIRPTLQITAPFLSQMVQRKRLLKDKKVKMFLSGRKMDVPFKWKSTQQSSKLKLLLCRKQVLPKKSSSLQAHFVKYFPKL